MLKSMLIGLDGSKYSDSALELGLKWAKEFGATLVGLGIVDEPTIAGPTAVPVGAASYKEHRDRELLVKAKEQIDRYLESFRNRCTQESVNFEILEDVGDPAKQIERESQRVDLVLLGRQSYFVQDFDQDPDDTLDRVLRSSTRPIVTVPEMVRKGDAIILLHDDTSQCSRTIQLLALLGLAKGKRTIVLRVGDDPSNLNPEASMSAEYLSSHGAAAEEHVLPADELSPELFVELSDKFSAGLVAIGASTVSRIRELLFGSRVKQAISNSPVPVFLSH